MAGKSVIQKSGNGNHHFVLKAANDEIIATSESYNSKASARASRG